MKTQKRTVYVMIILSILCAGLYAICVFLWKTDETSTCSSIKTYISNIILGLLGSSVISGIVAFIMYLQNRKDTLEKYIFKYHELTTHCDKYMDIKDYRERKDWFDDFVKYVRDLETIWSDIGFLFDIHKYRNLLKSFADYYNDFIYLTENDYRLLGENISEAQKQKISEEIDRIVIDKKRIKKRASTHIVRYNRFIDDMASVNNAINNIYNNEKPKYIRFNKSLVTKDNFVILDDDLEKYAKKMIELMKETGETNIELDIPEKVCKKLIDADYISSYTNGKSDLRKVNCQFILYHYFELKKRCIDI